MKKWKNVSYDSPYFTIGEVYEQVSAGVRRITLIDDDGEPYGIMEVDMDFFEPVEESSFESQIEDKLKSIEDSVEFLRKLLKER